MKRVRRRSSDQQFRILRQQRVRMSDHVTEGAEIVLAQHALDRGKYAGDFLASPDDLLV